ncbi:MAG: hypothetical protein QOF20_3433 [Acidimicrobiaceae bacterium]|jgi:hypothetical protein|nr:hypothetical protein [Acidimicrobiaceae bacterium]MDQ1376544.1 hypothetical protein [Acidimicrobiaceae bacterium]MDQ1419581.1 hypothetical protein [Acidimicrobiaceae bacterium]MDQ1441948.1 hypothetical protein [Acidimicrobiaceae bacterium]
MDDPACPSVAVFALQLTGIARFHQPPVTAGDLPGVAMLVDSKPSGHRPTGVVNSGYLHWLIVR